MLLMLLWLSLENEKMQVAKDYCLKKRLTPREWHVVIYFFHVRKIAVWSNIIGVNNGPLPNSSVSPTSDHSSGVQARTKRFETVALCE